MNFGQLVAPIALKVSGDSGVQITSLTYDSRRVQPGALFICLRGLKHDGHHYAAAAVQAGAVALLTEEVLPLPVPQALVADSRRAMLTLARQFFGNPPAELGLVGVTGTNGKTTTAYMIRTILLAAQSAQGRGGQPVGLIGTVQNFIGWPAEPAVMTTPEAPDLMQLWRRALDAGCRWLVMEVSSHALAQDRITPADFDVAVFTNITRDHFEFHQDFPAYLAAKERLFTGLPSLAKAGGFRAAVVNVDDASANHIMACTEAPTVTYGLENPRAEVTAFGLTSLGHGLSLEIKLPGTSGFPVELQLPGRFNAYNALAAAAAAWSLGVPPRDIKSGLEAITGVPGRAEVVAVGQDFEVLVDFAHNPAALANILTLRPRSSLGRVILVFGAEGGKDPGKRWAMGAAASQADYAIITSDNMYTEDPAQVAAQLAAPLAHRPHEIELDRRSAIARALALARSGDLVIIAGKGHEQTWHYLGRAIPFDDRQVVRELLAARVAEGTHPRVAE